MVGRALDDFSRDFLVLAPVGLHALSRSERFLWPSFLEE